MWKHWRTHDEHAEYELAFHSCPLCDELTRVAPTSGPTPPTPSTYLHLHLHPSCPQSLATISLIISYCGHHCSPNDVKCYTSVAWAPCNVHSSSVRAHALSPHRRTLGIIGERCVHFETSHSVTYFNTITYPEVFVMEVCLVGGVEGSIFPMYLAKCA